MKLRNRIISLLTAATFGLSLTAPANADLILTLSDGESTVTRTDWDDDGAVLFVGSVGDWVLNITLGAAGPIIGSDNSSRLDLSSINIQGRSNSGGTLTIALSSTDNDVPYGYTSYMVDVGGTTDGNVSFQSYLDNTNTAFGQGTLLYDTGLLTGSAYSSTAGGNVGVDGPYSITTVATITHAHGYSLTGFNHSVEIPEPGILALFGIGLICLGLGLRRRNSAIAT